MHTSGVCIFDERVRFALDHHCFPWLGGDAQMFSLHGLCGVKIETHVHVVTERVRAHAYACAHSRRIMLLVMIACVRFEQVFAGQQAAFVRNFFAIAIFQQCCCKLLRTECYPKAKAIQIYLKQQSKAEQAGHSRRHPQRSQSFNPGPCNTHPWVSFF